ncbi:MAG: hypothetical protein WEC75_03545 [Dehalococcoidia bacterium]
MSRVDTGAAFAFAADGATAVAAAFNAVWLAARPARRERTPGRRFAAAVLATTNAGIAMQAVFAQALFSARRFDLATDPFFTPGPWLASRLLLLAGTLLLSLLIVRRMGR